MNTKPNPLKTIDIEVARIRVDGNRKIVVHVRQHAGKTYIRFRYWHRHRINGFWYPDSHRWGPRAFILPRGRAAALGRALIEAADGGGPRDRAADTKALSPEKHPGIPLDLSFYTK